MRWFKPSLRNSLYGLLGQAPSANVLENGTEDVREAMLELLGEDGARQFPIVTRRIRYATDIQALWYLRGDLMAALSQRYGETAARRHVEQLSRMFNGLLPRSLMARHSPLES